jgi:hypothetical protein
VALAQRRREGEAEGAEKGRMLKLRRWSATGESNRTTISANKKRKLVQSPVSVTLLRRAH